MAVLDTLDTLAPIREKVISGERLDFDDGVALMETDDLLALGELADLARRQRGGGDEVYFVQNINLYQTNVCRVKCKFCAFARTNKQEDAFTLSADEFVEDAVEQHELLGFTEIHTVNGESPHVGIDYYAELLRKLKVALPDVHLKFYTASEIHHISKLEGCSVSTGKWKVHFGQRSRSTACSAPRSYSLSWSSPQHGQMRSRRVLTSSKLLMMSSMIAPFAAHCLACLW